MYTHKKVTSLILTTLLVLLSVSFAFAGSSYTASPGRYSLCNDPNGVNVDHNDYIMIDYINLDGIRFTSVWDAIYIMNGVTGTYNSADNRYYFTYQVPTRPTDMVWGYLWIENDWLHMELTGMDNQDLNYVLQQYGYISTTYHYNDNDRLNSNFFNRYGYFTGLGYYLYNNDNTSFYNLSTENSQATQPQNRNSQSSSKAQQSSSRTSQSSSRTQQGGYALAIQKLATRTGPGTQYAEPGTFNVAGQWIHILAKHYDVNDVCWVKCEIPTSNGTIIAWTGWKRFDHSTLDINTVPYGN